MSGSLRRPSSFIFPSKRLTPTPCPPPLIFTHAIALLVGARGSRRSAPEANQYTRLNTIKRMQFTFPLDQPTPVSPALPWSRGPTSSHHRVENNSIRHGRCRLLPDSARRQRQGPSSHLAGSQGFREVVAPEAQAAPAARTSNKHKHDRDNPISP